MDICFVANDRRGMNYSISSVDAEALCAVTDPIEDHRTSILNSMRLSSTRDTCSDSDDNLGHGDQEQDSSGRAIHSGSCNAHAARGGSGETREREV